MQNVWPWLAVAGLGALHGLSPANGWMFAAAGGIRAGDGARVRRMLPAIALGHAASVAIVVCAIAQGIVVDRSLAQCVAGGALVLVASCRWLRGGRMHAADRHANQINATTAHAGMAIWSCLMATAHGAGLMLVPALVPLCMASLPAREITASGSLLLALAAVGVHLAAMLLTTALVAAGACRLVLSGHPLMAEARLRHAWTAVLAVTGVSLITLR